MVTKLLDFALIPITITLKLVNKILLILWIH